MMVGTIETCHSTGCEKEQPIPTIGFEIQRFEAALQSHSEPPCANIGARDRRR